jgi:hypothetical protein
LTSRSSRRQPRACAYFCNVANDGEYFPLPDSKRAIADCVVPILSATSAWVTPAAARAFKNSSRMANSSSSRSYSALTSARLRERSLSSLCVSIFDLLHPPSGCFKFSRRYSPRQDVPPVPTLIHCQLRILRASHPPMNRFCMQF